MKRRYWTTAERGSRHFSSLNFASTVRNYLCLLLVLTVASCASSPDRGPAPEVRPEPTATEEPKFVDVNLCDLLNRPKDFNDREVRVSAILIGGFESSYAYDPRCVSDDRLVWYEVRSDSVNRLMEPYFDYNLPEFKEKGVNRVWGRFVGIFETKKKEGFGHLNSANHRLIITNAADLGSVGPNQPYPCNEAQKRE